MLPFKISYRFLHSENVAIELDQNIILYNSVLYFWHINYLLIKQRDHYSVIKTILIHNFWKFVLHPLTVQTFFDLLFYHFSHHRYSSFIRVAINLFLKKYN